MGKFKDLTGQKFGHWTVLSYEGKSKWLCECDCEKHTRHLVSTCNLKSGASTCCGCQPKKRTKPTKRTVNEYIFHEDYVEGKGNRGKSFFVDYEDYEKIKGIRWTCDDKGYWSHHELHGKATELHRYIMDAKPGVIIDHKDQNPSNNRRSNLREASVANNRHNTKPSVCNKSGVIGVRWAGNSWEANIKVNGKKHYLGRYANKEDAIIARLKGELKYLDIEFAPNRGLYKKYNLIK